MQDADAAGKGGEDEEGAAGEAKGTAGEEAKQVMSWKMPCDMKADAKEGRGGACCGVVPFFVSLLFVSFVCCLGLLSC